MVSVNLTLTLCFQQGGAVLPCLQLALHPVIILKCYRHRDYSEIPLISSHQSVKDSDSSLPKRPCWLYQLGLVDYQKAWDWQRQLVCDRIHNPQLPDTLLLLEHPPVYTLGQGASLDFLKFNPDQSDYALHRIEREVEKSLITVRVNSSAIPF